MIKKYTEKPFYKKYTHKVTILQKSSIVDNEMVYPCDNIEATLDWCIANFGEYTFKYRTDTLYHNTYRETRILNAMMKKLVSVVDGYQTTIYFSGEENLKNILAEYGDQITVIHKPKNKKHAELMENGTKSVMRNTLYYSKFRYKVVCDKPFIKRGKNVIQQIEEICSSDVMMREWFDDNTTEDTSLLNPSYYRYTAYFTEENDVMLFKLTFGDIIKESMVVLLPEEI